MELSLPTGSYLELSFYVADGPEQAAFARLVTTLVQLGAHFTGVGSGYVGVDARRPFGAIPSLPREKMQVHSLADVAALTHDPERRLVTVYMQDASGINPGIAEYVTYTDISSQAAAQQENHPFAIWTKDGDLGYPFYLEDPERAHTLGQMVYARFRAIVLGLQPAYANITIEAGLQAPYDLRHRPGVTMFRTFYISRRYAGSDTIAALHALLREAYTEAMGEGVYFSTWPFFNPQRHASYTSSVAFEPIEKEIKRLIGQAGLNR